MTKGLQMQAFVSVNQWFSTPAQDMDEFITHRLLLDQLIAGLLGKGLEVPDGAGIGGHDLEQLAALHGSQRFLGLENGQRTVQAAGVNFLIYVHGVDSSSAPIVEKRALAVPARSLLKPEPGPP
jgi:hypothetical protein